MGRLLGVIFTGGESPSAQIIQRELEAKDALVIAADSGLLVAEEAGIKPHYIIGDMDSVDAARLEPYPAESVIRHAADKDYTDTELAFSLAVEKGCEEIWLIGGGGGRIDHLFAIRSLFEREIFPRRWIADNADIFCVDAKEEPVNTTFKTDKTVSIFPLGDGPWKVKSKGLKWALDELNWDRGFFGLSNVASAGEFSITVVSGRFLVIT